MRTAHLLILAALSCTAPLRAQQPGDLDPWFNTDDIGYGSGEGANDPVRALCVQPDGKVLIGGMFSTFNGEDVARIVRVDVDGRPDPGFNAGLSANSWVRAIAVQPDGRVLVGGNFTSFGGQNAGGIVRLNPDGTRDMDFNMGTGMAGGVYAFAVQPDGRILVGGDLTSYNGTPAVGLVRLEADGTLDIGFDIGTGITGAVYGIALQDDGRVVVAGSFGTYDGVDVGNIIRLTDTGALDETFAIGTGPDGAVNRVRIQPDQRIIIAGTFTHFNGVAHEQVIRLEPDGSPDPGFVPPNIDSSTLNGLDLNPDGTILVGGSINQVNGQAYRHVVRLNADGSLDEGFNTGAGGFLLYDLAACPDGKVVVGGAFTTFDDLPQGRVARLNADGGLDLTFNRQTGANGSVRRVRIDAEGRIVAAGDFDAYNGQLHENVVRLLEDGSADPAFNTSGLDVNDALYDMALQPDGKVLICGFGMEYGSSSGTVMRLLTDGSLDPGFVPAADNVDVSALAVQSDGKVLVGGDFTTYNGVPRARIVRLNPDGTVDETFDPGTGPNNGIKEIVVQPDGKVLIIGYFTSVAEVSRPFVARLNADGTLDTGFNPGTGPSASPIDIVLQPDGKVLLGGVFTSFNGTQLRGAVRLNVDGTRDPSFDAVPGANGMVTEVAVDAMGRILIAGLFTTWDNTARPGMARLNPNGSVDTSFDPGSGPIGPVGSIAIQADEKIVIAGSFTSYDGIGRNRFARLFGELSTGTADPPRVSLVYAWPVPATDAVRLRLPDGTGSIAHVRVVDAAARRMYVPFLGGARANELLLHISALTTGSYYAEMIDRNGVVHRATFVKSE